VFLEGLMHAASGRDVTIDWLMAQLGDRSFGMILLVFGLMTLVPGISALASLLLLVPAGQMVLARPAPSFPARIGARRISMQRLAPLLRRALPALRWLERTVRPRWATPFEMTKRVIGATVALLAVAQLTPVPLVNAPPALIMLLIAIALLEQDGVLLSIALALALLLLGGVAFLTWETFGT